jgi:hypothetical protein
MLIGPEDVAGSIADLPEKIIPESRGFVDSRWEISLRTAKKLEMNENILNGI